MAANPQLQQRRNAPTDQTAAQIAALQTQVTTLQAQVAALQASVAKLTKASGGA